MPAVNQGPATFLALDVGETVTITANSTSSGLVRRVMPDGGNLPGAQLSNVLPGGSVIFGPFPTVRHFSIECVVGSLTYTLSKDEFGRSALLGNIEGFTGNRTLIAQDNGKIFRCDDTLNVTITVPGNLTAGFNVGFAMWGGGTVTVQAGVGATNRSSTLALINQYDVGSVLVMKGGEFVLGGSFI